MKGKNIRLFLILIAVCLCSLLACCAKGKFVQSVEFTDGQTVVTYEGGFEFSKYTLTVTYTDGTTREVPITEEMISPVEQTKLYRAGTWQVEVDYLGVKTSFDAVISKAEIEDFVTLE
ncbi:MAG: hypothetical protein MJ072_00260, partial [Clostridia bacterium]|nr:hypothetical protein [Clostridia bacterium]